MQTDERHRRKHLQLSRREQSKPESVELGEFLTELVGEFLSTQKAKNVEFKTNIARVSLTWCSIAAN